MFPHDKTPLLYLITNGAATNNNFRAASERILKIIKAAVAARIALVQIREKQLTAKNLFELTRKAAKITQNTESRLLVNDRADIAFCANADGVHLTENSISAKAIRQFFPANFIVGVSCHAPETILKAKSHGADFATFSPIFASPGKAEQKGLEKLRAVCELSEPFPIVALGGIDETNLESVFKVGASGAAAIRLFDDVERLPELAERARKFKNE